MDKIQDDASSAYSQALRAVNQTYAEMGLAAKLAPLLKFVDVQPTEAPFLEQALALSPADQGKLLWFVNKQIGEPMVRQRIGYLFALWVREHAGIPQPDASAAGADFARDGFLPLPGLVSPAEAKEMLDYFTSCPNVMRQDTVLHHDIKDVIRAPHAFRIATDPRVLSVAANHIGAPATIVQMDAWWSLPESQEPHGAQVFHRDRDDFRSCKLFLYLSEVTSGDGPHIFVRGSHRPEGVTDALAAIGALAEKVPVFFKGNGREVAHLVDQVFGASVMEITGGPGTCFLENTFGFHRGKIPQTGRRCIFQVLYASIAYPERVRHLAGGELKALPSDCPDSPLARHAVRFAVT